MKKIIAITFILLIGLVVLGGCTSTTSEPTTKQEDQTKNPNTESDPDIDTNLCVHTLNFSDGETQNIILSDVTYEIKAHIESEDNWASFSVDGDFGQKGQFYTDQWGTMLMLPDNEHGVSNKNTINEVSIMLLEVGYDTYNEEYAVVCIS